MVKERASFLEGVKSKTSSEAQERALARLKQDLQRNPLVESVDYNYLRKPSFIPNDPRVGQQYGLRSKIVARKNFTFFGGPSDTKDGLGHGTHVADIVAAATDNARGVAGGCSDCKLLVARSVGRFGGYDSDISQGIVWSANHGARVINLSLGGHALLPPFTGRYGTRPEKGRWWWPPRATMARTDATTRRPIRRCWPLP